MRGRDAAGFGEQRGHGRVDLVVPGGECLPQYGAGPYGRAAELGGPDPQPGRGDPADRGHDSRCERGDGDVQRQTGDLQHGEPLDDGLGGAPDRSGPGRWRLGLSPRPRAVVLAGGVSQVTLLS